MTSENDGRILLVGTHNPGKAREIQALLAPLGVTVKTLADLPDAPPPVDETGDTYLANAQLKAETYADATRLPTLADDSGLEVHALDGAPGIHSARYAGEDGDAKKNTLELLAALADVPADERTAEFVCVVVLATPGGDLRPAINLHIEARVQGTILEAPQGEGGFGYDPVFFHPPHNRTFAELTPDEKNAVSHRGQALRAMSQAIASHADAIWPA